MIEKIFRLTDEQRYFYDNQKTAPNSTMYNHFPMLEKLKEWVDIEKLIKSLLKTLEAHPAYLTVIEERNGVPVQRYIPDIINNIPVEKISEAELMTLKDDLIQPFYFGQVMCRFKIFITEKAKYLFFDDHHIVCDGFGKVIFLHDIQKVYDGQEISCDSWFDYLREHEAVKSSKHYNESKIWYENRYGNVDFCGYPNTDFSVGGVID